MARADLKERKMKAAAMGCTEEREREDRRQAQKERGRWASQILFWYKLLPQLIEVR
jgi:hypothetical protein